MSSDVQVAVITGASAGIGRAAALAFTQRRWRVALVARGLDGLRGAEKEVQEAGGMAFVVQADVADAHQVEAAADRIERECGPIAVWINNAMATIFSPFMEMDPDEFRRATEVTYLGAVWGTHAALKRMRARDAGTIVQVGSALAYRSIPLQSAYCGAKSGLRGFTDSLRTELIHDGSRVHLTMVHLSAFNTPQFDWGRNRMGRLAKPLGKIFQPEVAGEAIYWASQQRRREVWVGYPAVQAILGTRLIPALLDRYLAYSAYEGQLADSALPAGYTDNLVEPVPGDHGTHGRFSNSALPSSLQFWLNSHRWTLVGAVVTAMVVLGLALAVAV
jgi:NAD(P)-dependent dehydrogenase (short-subunit alcohol dehydrogenase family)